MKLSPAHKPWPAVIAMIIVLSVAAACSLSDIPSLGLSGGPLPTPTPLGDTLTLLVPAYSVSLEAGERVPGTQLEFVGQADSGYEVKIDGLRALKQSGDSFSWAGVIAPGVSTRHKLRLTATVFGQMTAAGPVDIIIFSPQPAELTINPITEPDLNFKNLAIQYRVLPGGSIPGTSLVYEGYRDPESSDQVAQRMATLSGTRGYPFVAIGDSMIWLGQLRENVVIRHSLRVLTIDENGLSLVGTAELWIDK